MSGKKLGFGGAGSGQGDAIMGFPLFVIGLNIVRSGLL